MKDLNSVFDHDANLNSITALRAAVVDDILWLQSNYPDFGRVTKSDLKSGVYEQLREKYQPLLHYGSFSLGKRAVINELIWKWTEATGKYVGCQYWSAKAKKLFDLEVQNSGGWPITAKRARLLEKRLSTKTGPKEEKLTHEHVYPIKDMKLWLSGRTNLTRKEIQSHFERQCVACVLLESEHDRSVGNDESPWLRYKKVGVYLAPNPAWPDIQHSLINDAALVECA